MFKRLLVGLCVSLLSLLLADCSASQGSGTLMERAASCPAVATRIPYAQLLAQTRSYVGCDIETEVAFVGAGSGGLLTGNHPGYSLFRVVPPGQSPSSGALGMDFSFLVLPDAAAGVLFSAAAGQRFLARGTMEVRLNNGYDPGSWGRSLIATSVTPVGDGGATPTPPGALANTAPATDPARTVVVSPPRVALVVEGALSTPEFQLAIRQALLESSVTLVRENEVEAARAFVGRDALTPSNAAALRARLDADRVLVVQTIATSTPSAPEATPAGRHGRHHRRHRRHGETPDEPASAPVALAMQVFVSDRGAAPPPQSRMGPASVLVAEVGAMIRALQPAAGSTAQATSIASVSPPTPSMSGVPTESTQPLTSNEGTQAHGGAPPSRMWIDLGFYKGNPDLSQSIGAITYGLSPEVGFALRVAQVYTVHLSFTGALGDGTGNNGPGNPAAGLSRWFDVGPGHLEAGALLTVPLAQIPKGTFQRLAVSDALHGLWDGWRWVNGGLSLVAFGRYNWSSGAFDLRGELAMGAFIPVGDSQSSSQFFAQLGASPFYRFGVRSGVGLDLRGVWRPALDGLFQISMVPRIRLSPGSVDIDTWLNLNLNEPLGFSFDSGKVWGFGVTVGFPI
jgi:hypothetical protein